MPKGQLLGYIRVSSIEQNISRQLEGIELDKKFIDRVSGKDDNRPELKRLLEYAREHDTIIVHSMDRLARNLDDLRRIVTDCTNRGVEVKFVKEGLTYSNEQSSLKMLLLSVTGAVAEFERALIRERQMDGILLAKQRGVYKGRKRTLTDEQIAQLKARCLTRENRSIIAKDFKISRATLYVLIQGEEGCFYKPVSKSQGKDHVSGIININKDDKEKNVD